jgi:hypothetical protein
MIHRLADVDTDLIIDIVSSSDGDLALATERLNHRLKLDGTILEYELEARLASLDNPTADKLAGRLRTLLTVKLYNLVIIATDQLKSSMGDLKPAELARTHASLVNSFTAITAPAAKITFDFATELEAIAREFPEYSKEELNEQLKEIERRAKAK